MKIITALIKILMVFFPAWLPAVWVLADNYLFSKPLPDAFVIISLAVCIIAFLWLLIAENQEAGSMELGCLGLFGLLVLYTIFATPILFITGWWALATIQGP